MRETLQVVALAVAVLAGAPPALAHRFHASLAEVAYDAKEGKVEVGVRLFADDLEEALGRVRGGEVRLDATPDADRLVLEYLRETLTLTDPDGRVLRWEWVGKELRVDELWVFVQADSPAGLDGATARSRILFELFDDQVNTVNLRQGPSRTSLVFKRGDGGRKVIFQ